MFEQSSIGCEKGCIIIYKKLDKKCPQIKCLKCCFCGKKNKCSQRYYKCIEKNCFNNSKFHRLCTCLTNLCSKACRKFERILYWLCVKKRNLSLIKKHNFNFSEESFDEEIQEARQKRKEN